MRSYGIQMTWHAEVNLCEWVCQWGTGWQRDATHLIKDKFVFSRLNKMCILRRILNNYTEKKSDVSKLERKLTFGLYFGYFVGSPSFHLPHHPQIPTQIQYFPKLKPKFWIHLQLITTSKWPEKMTKISQFSNGGKSWKWIFSLRGVCVCVCGGGSNWR